jgi:hypothetical protein
MDEQNAEIIRMGCAARSQRHVCGTRQSRRGRLCCLKAAATSRHRPISRQKMN